MFQVISFGIHKFEHFCFVRPENLSDARNIKLRVTPNAAKCAFEYTVENGSWETLAVELDATLLTTDVAGGFVGVTVGPFARSDQNGN